MTEVVVSGIGTVNSIAHNVSQYREALRAGVSGAGPITLFDPEGFATTIAAEVKEFDPKTVIDRKDARKMDRYSHFAVAAAVEAFNDAGLADAGFDSERVGVVLGVGIGGFESLEASYWSLFQSGPDRVSPMTIPKLIANIAPAHVAIILDLQGPVLTVTTACASGTDAIGEGKRLIESGVCDVVLAGGAEASITRIGIAGFNSMKAMTTSYNDSPQRASRPFDRDRDGFLMGEGAGVLVLESAEHAAKRGARSRARLLGYGVSCDAYHLTAPHPEGRGAIAAMKMALRDGGIDPSAVDYINAHGTSTPLNDKVETAAIKQVFGEHAYKLKVSSTKSMTGHVLGGAGGIEAVASIVAIEDGFFPPTINIENQDPELDLDYVPNTAQEGEISVAMSNTFGFGGHNGIALFGKA